MSGLLSSTASQSPGQTLVVCQLVTAASVWQTTVTMISVPPQTPSTLQPRPRAASGRQQRSQRGVGPSTASPAYFPSNISVWSTVSALQSTLITELPGVLLTWVCPLILTTELSEDNCFRLTRMERQHTGPGRTVMLAVQEWRAPLPSHLQLQLRRPQQADLLPRLAVPHQAKL